MTHACIDLFPCVMSDWITIPKDSVLVSNFSSYISMEEVLVVLVESVHNISVRFHHISLTQLSSTTGMKAKSCSLTPLPSQRPERIRGFDTRLGYYSTSASQLNEKLPFDPCLTYFIYAHYCPTGHRKMAKSAKMLPNVHNWKFFQEIKGKIGGGWITLSL